MTLTDSPNSCLLLADNCRPRRPASNPTVGVGHRLPFSALCSPYLPILLWLIVMPLDRMVHAYAEHYDFECEEDVGKPIYPRTIGHFEYFHYVAWNCRSARIALARNAPPRHSLQGREACLFSRGLLPFVAKSTAAAGHVQGRWPFSIRWRIALRSLKSPDCCDSCA